MTGVAGKDFQIPQKRYTADQIIPMLRQADVELGQSKKILEVCKLLDICSADLTLLRRQKYGNIQPEMSKELKALQKENARLKRLVVEQADAKTLFIAPGSPRKTATLKALMENFVMSCLTVNCF